MRTRKAKEVTPGSRKFICGGSKIEEIVITPQDPLVKLQLIYQQDARFTNTKTRVRDILDTTKLHQKPRYNEHHSEKSQLVLCLSCLSRYQSLLASPNEVVLAMTDGQADRRTQEPRRGEASKVNLSISSVI